MQFNDEHTWITEIKQKLYSRLLKVRKRDLPGINSTEYTQHFNNTAILLSAMNSYRVNTSPTDTVE